jgi:DNA-binding NtrC family response regulator
MLMFYHYINIHTRYGQKMRFMRTRLDKRRFTLPFQYQNFAQAKYQSPDKKDREPKNENLHKMHKNDWKGNIKQLKRYDQRFICV